MKKETLFGGIAVLFVAGVLIVNLWGQIVAGYQDFAQIATPGNPSSTCLAGGPCGRVYISSGASGTLSCLLPSGASCAPVSGALSLETNGTPNGSQSLLNLAAGSNMTLTDNGSGTVTFASSGGGGSSDYPFASGSSLTFTAPVPANWTAIGSGGSSATVTGLRGGNAIFLTGASGGGANGPFYGLTTPVSGTSWTHTFLLYGVFPLAAFPGGYGGACFSDGTKYEAVLFGYESGLFLHDLANTTFANAGSVVAANGDTFSRLGFTDRVIIQLSRSGSTLTGAASWDGGVTFVNEFVDTVPYLTVSSVCIMAGARGNANASNMYLESYQ